ncbi:hypothetical protein D3C75_253650 [compost metagenome]
MQFISQAFILPCHSRFGCGLLSVQTSLIGCGTLEDFICNWLLLYDIAREVSRVGIMSFFNSFKFEIFRNILFIIIYNDIKHLFTLSQFVIVALHIFCNFSSRDRINVI